MILQKQLKNQTLNNNLHGLSSSNNLCNCLTTRYWFFAKNVSRLSRNIKLGKDVDVSDNTGQRWKNMAKIALGQTKMVVRPIAGFLHVIVYVGFIIINIEVLEIILDGLFGNPSPIRITRHLI